MNKISSQVPTKTDLIAIKSKISTSSTYRRFRLPAAGRFNKSLKLVRPLTNRNTPPRAVLDGVFCVWGDAFKDYDVRGSFFCHLVTIFAVSGAIPIVAIEPLLNFRKSVSMPSLKITPFVGINDSIVKTFWFFITPAVIPVCVLIL